MQLQTSEPLYQIMLARYYGAKLGRFLSKDPRPGARRIVDPQGWNGYTYCLGNPLKYFDPDGNDIVFAAGQKPGFIDRMTNAIAQASRNAGAASDIQNADASSASVVLKEGRLPVSKDRAKNTIDVGLGHTDVTKTDAEGRATEITVTVDTTNISNTWASGNRSEVKTDVEVVAHEIKHVNNQLTPEAQAKTNANPDAEEQEALDAGDAAANDPATEKKPTDEEKNKASTVLGPKK